MPFPIPIRDTHRLTEVCYVQPERDRRLRFEADIDRLSPQVLWPSPGYDDNFEDLGICPLPPLSIKKVAPPGFDPTGFDAPSPLKPSKRGANTLSRPTLLITSSKDTILRSRVSTSMRISAGHSPDFESGCEADSDQSGAPRTLTCIFCPPSYPAVTGQFKNEHTLLRFLALSISSSLSICEALPNQGARPFLVPGCHAETYTMRVDFC